MADISCIICKEKVNKTDDSVVLQHWGADGINSASKQRNSEVIAEAGDTVHVKCCKIYVDKKDIKKWRKYNLNQAKKLSGHPIQ